MKFKLFLLIFNILVIETFGKDVGRSATKLSVANNDFGLRLQGYLSDGKSNVFMSPFSIQNAFAMLYSGAKGVTGQQLRQVLGYDLANLTDQELMEQFKEELDQLDNQVKPYELRVANKMLVQNGFGILETYDKSVRNSLKSSIDSVDFADKPRETMNAVNQFVANQTNNKITKLLDTPLSSATKLLLLNAVYFEAKFKKRFRREDTSPVPFYDWDDNQTLVFMMQRIGEFNHTEVPELESSLLEIPYSGGDISLFVLLPNERQGLKDLKNKLSSFKILEDSVDKLTVKTVSVMIPKFKVETSYSLADTLRKMGITSAFDSDADLSGINGQKSLQVSKVIHKAFVEMSEEGTIAAATTGISVVLKNKIIPAKEYLTFKADHPFVFFIRNNKNGIVLFSGHINQL